MASRALACPALITPAAMRRCTVGGSRRRRIVLEICGRERLIRPASSSWVQPKSSSVWSTEQAVLRVGSAGRDGGSPGGRREAARDLPFHAQSPGIVSSRACCAARQRRSPMTSSNLAPLNGRTTMGCSGRVRGWTPRTLHRLLIQSGSGCRGFGEIESRGRLAKSEPTGTGAIGAASTGRWQTLKLAAAPFAGTAHPNPGRGRGAPYECSCALLYAPTGDLLCGSR